MTTRALVSASLLLGALAVGSCSRSRSAAPRTSGPSPNIITAEDIERSPGTPLEQLLAARVPGITLATAADGHIAIHIRGTTTLHGDEEPLYVLDGIPLEPSPSGNLSAIDRHDVAMIEVLRDAVGIARYGARGANGVIVIKTKRPPA